MWRCVWAFLTLSLVGLGLVGCGRFGGEQRAAWRTQAEEACLASKLVQPTAYMSRISEIDGPGACGISYPFKVQAFAQGSVALTNRVTLGCPIIPEIDGWIRDTVQPAAELYFGSAVTAIRAGTYSCRGRNNQPGAKISEHAFGNAMDVMSFKFSDGRDLSVEKGWKGAPEEQDFLREVFLGACRHFTTVLAPGSDVYHYNHLHLDLARHDARGTRRICKPIIKFDPRLDPDAVAAPRRAPPRPAIGPEPAEPLDIEDDADPFAVSAGARQAPVSRPSTVAAASPAASASAAASYSGPGRPQQNSAEPLRSATAPAAPGPNPARPAPATSTYAKSYTAPLPVESSRMPANPRSQAGTYAGTNQAGTYAGNTGRSGAYAGASGRTGPGEPMLLQPPLLSGSGLY